MIQVGDFGSSGKPSGSVCWLVQGGPDCKAAAAPTRQAPARPQAGQRGDPWTAALNLYHLILHVRGIVRNGFLDCGFWGSGARIEMQAWHPCDSSKTLVMRVNRLPWFGCWSDIKDKAKDELCVFV